MARAYYFELEYQKHDLRKKVEAQTPDRGVTTVDLRAAELTAMNVIRGLLTKEVGSDLASSLHTTWVDDTVTYALSVPQLIQDVARLLGSSLVWRRSESFLGFRRQSEDSGQLLPSEQLWKGGMALWNLIIKTGFLVNADGSTTDLNSEGDQLGIGIGSSATMFFPDSKKTKSHDLYPDFSLQGAYETMSSKW